MRKPGTIAVASIFAVICTIPAIAASEKTLKECQAIKRDIASLDELRQKGGRASRMDTWKRRIHDLQDDYSRLNCRRYRFKLG